MYGVSSHEVAPMCGFDVCEMEVASESDWCQVQGG